jgi:uncharacterized protein with PIN domain
MTNRCFYCGEEMKEKEQHEVAFFQEQTEHIKMLCSHCYREWLEGIKG